MHCKLPCTADVGRAESWQNWQEGGRVSETVFIYLSAVFLFFCLFVFLFIVLRPDFLKITNKNTHKKDSNKNNRDSMYCFL